MRLLAAATLAFGLAVPAMAEDVTPDVSDPITLRMTAMKQVGAAMGALGAMAKGEAEFSAPVAAMSVRAMLAAGAGYAYLFPEGSETGHETTAAPAIWEDRAGFEAEVAAFLVKLGGVAAAPPTERAALGAVMGELGGSCRSCHEGYRVKRN